MTAAAGSTPSTLAPARSRWPQFAEDEIEATVRVLRSGRVNRWTGEECNLFEREFAAYCGTRHALSLANGTLALELPLRVLGIGAGDEVITTPRSFFATAGAIVLSGARVVFADVDPDSQNITAETIRSRITPRTKAIIVVHLAGWPADMDPIMELARQHGLCVIEDCAQAHGARYKGRHVGSIGHFGAFSFCQDKIMTTGGEGGMLLLNDDAWWKAAWSFRDHGKNHDKAYASNHPPGFRWLHDGFGSNWRMTEMQAAIGRAQLRKLDGWVTHRRANAACLNGELRQLASLRVPEPPADCLHACYKYYVFVGQGVDRDSLIAQLQLGGVVAFSGSCPEMYREQAFDGTDVDREAFPVAARLGRESLMFQIDPTLDIQDMRRIAGAVRDALGALSSPTDNSAEYPT